MRGEQRPQLILGLRLGREIGLSRQSLQEIQGVTEVDAGVRTIEHGNLIDAPTARRMRECDAFLVPTLVTYFAIDDLEDPLAAEVRVRARAHLRVEAPAASSFRVVDRAGQPVPLMRMRADGYSTSDTLPLTDGRSGVVSVTTDAVELWLCRGDTVLERVPLQLRPGDVVTIAR